MLHDTRGLVTSAHESGRHDFLCLVQVSSVAVGRLGERPGSDLSRGFLAAESLVPVPQLQSMQDGYVELGR